MNIPTTIKSQYDRIKKAQQGISDPSMQIYLFGILQGIKWYDYVLNGATKEEIDSVTTALITPK